jgi:hypothetical protein
MGAGGEAPWKDTSGSGFILHGTGAFRRESGKPEPLFLPMRAAAPGPGLQPEETVANELKI